MPDVVIKVENLSKAYRLGQITSGTLTEDLNRWWARARGKPDPYLKIGQTDHGNQQGEYTWALNDVSFEVQEGEVLGIIGRNGAGKSTLLKILSRITSPTSGKVKVKGRIASLLEVGTGFHPELTGRENIYLNGAILGMRRSEIDRKFDEIVDFAGIEKFVNTPVKRYSSGMYVRLAFAVAAHLEPEILLVDEVLAVGDAEFQKKCLGKMGDIAKEGRTVLFVSHNMAAVQSLCHRAMVLEKGDLVIDTFVEKAVSFYLENAMESTGKLHWELPKDDYKLNHKALISSVQIVDIENNPVSQQSISQPFVLAINYYVFSEGIILNLSISAYSKNDIYVFSSPSITDMDWFSKPHNPGKYESRCIIPGNLLNQGIYSFSVLLVERGRHIMTQLEKIVSLELFDMGDSRAGYYGYWGGVTRPILKWKTNYKGNRLFNE